jgi:hypothetical protein
MGAMPKKYVKVNGIMKLNPEYKKWKEAQNSSKPATTVLSSSQALPIVSSMEDYATINEDLNTEIVMSESTVATIEMIQEPEIAMESGLQPDDMVDELGRMLAKYEIPIGLTNKLMALSEFSSLEFILDDSGSMSLRTDTIDPRTNQAISRWAEAKNRLKEMIEVLAYVPFNQIGIEFLNRRDRIVLTKNNRTPDVFFRDATNQIEASFRKGPSGTTPAFEKLRESLLRGQGSNIARYFFGDGKPNGGKQAVDAIIKLLVNRSNPEGNPLTFISCTNEDEAVEWMKDAEEIAPYCSESDDFHDEAKEVLKDQGRALPFSKGFHLICQLVAAMNPDDLDAMDECIPFTKFTLNNLLGYQVNDETYRHYFEGFQDAQRKRPIEGPMDDIRKNTRWDYEAFLMASGTRKGIRQVAEVQRRLKIASGH